jgi:RNA-directed DNA polymerase
LREPGRSVTKYTKLISDPEANERSVIRRENLKHFNISFLHQVLQELPVHLNATAYKAGASIRDNAQRHTNSRVILKLDFHEFFNSVKVSDWRAYAGIRFPNWSDEDLVFSILVLFWGEGGYQPSCLAIGAPTSPLLSNVLMHQFDILLTEYADENELRYTRYADDMTFSTAGFLDKNAVIQKVGLSLSEIESPRLRLNPEKTRLASKATMRQVTGIVITNDQKISLGWKRKRIISSMVHHAIRGDLEDTNLLRLKGLLAFAEDIEPTFVAMLARKYGEPQLNTIRRAAPG